MKRYSPADLALFCIFSLIAVSISCNYTENRGDRNQEELVQNQEERSGENNVEVNDGNFLTQAAMINLKMMELARMGNQNGNAEIKSLSQKILDMHTRCYQDGAALANAKNVAYPKLLPETHQLELQETAKVTGAEFNSQFNEMVIREHRYAAQQFQEIAERGDDADIRGFASAHLQMLNDITQLAESNPQESSKNMTSNP